MRLLPIALLDLPPITRDMVMATFWNCVVSHRDVYVYNAAISACEKGREPGKALELLAEMRGRGMEPNVITYNAAISACEKGKEPGKALELLAEMRGRGMEPN
eukprot:gene9022-1114_t